MRKLSQNKWLKAHDLKPGGDMWHRYLKRAKYGNNTIVIGDNTYDSMKEYRRYLDLLMLEKAGEIEDLRRQVKFILIPAQREPNTVGKRGGIKKGKLLEREVAYFADFVYKDVKSGEIVVEDTKGMRTDKYIIKRKLMLYVHHIKIKEV